MVRAAPPAERSEDGQNNPTERTNIKARIGVP
jgi:hypothetical protein